MQRAVLAREKYQWDQSPASKSGKGYSYPFKIEDDRLARIRDHGALPSRAEQAANLIRFVGDEVSRLGEDLEQLPRHIHTIIGAVSLDSARGLATELREQGVFRSGVVKRTVKEATGYDVVDLRDVSKAGLIDNAPASD